VRGRAPRPHLGVVQPADRGVAARVRNAASIATSAASASGAAPPNTPECSSDASASTWTITSATPRRLTVTAGWPTASFPASQTKIASARSRPACPGTNCHPPRSARTAGSATRPHPGAAARRNGRRATRWARPGPRTAGTRARPGSHPTSPPTWHRRSRPRRRRPALTWPRGRILRAGTGEGQLPTGWPPVPPARLAPAPSSL
jgi:hypothetical protein